MATYLADISDEIDSGRGCADVHTVNSYGCNAAMWACQGGTGLEICRFLFVRGINFMRLNANGQGCLHKAAQRGQMDVSKWLVSASDGPQLFSAEEGAVHFSPNDFEKSTPSVLAKYAGFDELAEWLAEKERDRI